MEPKPGQIWKEVDPRMQRFIRIESVGHREASIRTVRNKEGHWTDAPKSRVTYCNINRFNGKRGGYEFVKGGELK